MAPRPEPVLKAVQATKAYADLVALAPLDLEVPAGQMLALVGHNGSGKSTFMRLASGLLELSSGEILIDGEPAGSPDARAALSFLPDEPVLYDDLSVREHVAYIAALHGVDLSEDELNGLIDRVGLSHRADDLPARFSRGLRQKTSIALGLVRPFDILLVDEPFVGLDASGKDASAFPARRLQQGGCGHRGGHPRPHLRGAGRAVHRPARRSGRPRRPGHARRRAAPRGGVVRRCGRSALRGRPVGRRRRRP